MLRFKSSTLISQLPYKLEQKIEVERQNIEKRILKPEEALKLKEFISWNQSLEGAMSMTSHGVTVNNEIISNLEKEIEKKYPLCNEYNNYL